EGDAPSTRKAEEPSTQEVNPSTNSKKDGPSSELGQSKPTTTQAPTTTTSDHTSSKELELPATSIPPSTSTSYLEAMKSSTGSTTAASSTGSGGSLSSSSPILQPSITSLNGPLSLTTTLSNLTRSGSSPSSSTSSALPTNACQARNNKRGEQNDLTKRNPAQLHMGQWNETRTTFYTFVPLRQETMCEDDIIAYARAGFNQIRDRHNWNGIIMVSALFVPNIGVLVGSKPRGFGF
ncbi:MAG: hypothetical protein Q9210_004347, partial [Variospora velana]